MKHLFTKKDWTTDYGFCKALEADPGQMRFGASIVGNGRKELLPLCRAIHDLAAGR